jgi:tetratricopeptide (TPR) repeat protein
MAADCQFKLRRIEEAVQLTGEALARFPNNLAIVYQRGCFLREARRMDEAAACLERVLAADGDALRASGMHAQTQIPIAHLTLGNIYRATKKFTESENQFRAAIACQPENPEGYFLLGHLFFWLGRNKEGHEFIAKLETLPGAEYECAMLKGHAYYYGRDLDTACRWIESAIKLRPEKAYTWNVLGLLLFRMGQDWERCLAVHEKVLEMEPHQPEARARLEEIKAVLARKSTRAGAVVEENAVASFHPGVMQVSGFAGRLSHFS